VEKLGGEFMGQYEPEAPRHTLLKLEDVSNETYEFWKERICQA